VRSTDQWVHPVEIFLRFIADAPYDTFEQANVCCAGDKAHKLQALQLLHIALATVLDLRGTGECELPGRPVDKLAASLFGGCAAPGTLQQCWLVAASRRSSWQEASSRMAHDWRCDSPSTKGADQAVGHSVSADWSASSCMSIRLA